MRDLYITRGRVFGAVSIVVGLLVLWLIYQGATAIVALNRASHDVDAFKQAAAAGDSASFPTTLASLQQHAATAADNTDGPLWEAMGALPWVGGNAVALSDISASIDEIARKALPPIVEVADAVNANVFTPHNGSVDTAAIARLRVPLAAASVAMSRADARLADVDPDRLFSWASGPVARLKDSVDHAAEATSASSVASELLPHMLGDQGVTRRYLLLIQTNAEVRAQGGIPGSWAVIEAHKGKVTMTQQGDIFGFSGGDFSPVLPLTSDEQRVFGNLLVTDPRDFTMTPDFPRTGQLARAAISRSQHIDVDGVISVDPVALGHLMGGTGPVRVGKVALDEDNAAAMLLGNSYKSLDEAHQDDFFKDAARAVFDKLVTGGGNPGLLLQGFADAVDENRIMLWSAHAKEQQRIAPTGVSGVFPGDDGATPHVGVYLNDSTETKLEYYLDFDANAVATKCEDDRQTIISTADLTSNVPSGLPESVTGNGHLVPKGSVQIVVNLFAPFGGSVDSVWVNGKAQTVYDMSLKGRPASFVSVVLAPGEHASLTAVLKTGKGQTGSGILSRTPGIASDTNDVPFASAC